MIKLGKGERIYSTRRGPDCYILTLTIKRWQENEKDERTEKTKEKKENLSSNMRIQRVAVDEEEGADLIKKSSSTPYLAFRQEESSNAFRHQMKHLETMRRKTSPRAAIRGKGGSPQTNLAIGEPADGLPR